MITPETKRRAKLEAAGVPVSFLNAIDTPPREDFEFFLRYPESCYFYLKTIASTYSILNEYEITPIYDGANGDTFWVLLSNGEENRFVHFELEHDEVYKDYGANFSLLLADFAIFFYESADETELDELIAVLRSIGFNEAESLIHAVADADTRGLRTSFEADAAWRSVYVPRIIQSGG